MSSADIKAGDAFVRLFLKNDLTGPLSRTLRKMSKQLTAAGASMSKVGMSAVRVASIAAVPFALALKTFASFDDQMRQVQAVTGATGSMFDQLTAKAKELGSTTAFTASQAADGMAFLGQAGFSAQQILEGIPAVLDLAAAGAIELGAAADIASNIAGGFGMASDEIGRVADVLAQAASSSNVNISELGEAFGKAGPAAKAAGQEIEEAAAAIGILGDSGVKGSLAGTDVQNILIEMAKRSEIAGVKTADASGNMRDMLSVMKDLGRATGGLSEAERLSFFIDTFGKRSAKSAIILSSANKRIDEMREKLANAEGRAKSMAATMEGGIGGSWRKFKSAVEGVAIAIGESLAPTLKMLADKLAGVMGKVTAFIEKNKGVVKAVAATIAAVLAGGAALMAIGSTLTTIGVAMGGMAAIVAAIGAALGMLFTPFGVVAGLLVAGTALWARYTSSGKAAVKKVLSSLAEFGAKAKEIFGSIWKAMMSGDFTTAFELVKTTGLLAFNALKDRVGWIFLTYVPGVVQATFAGLARVFVVVVKEWRKVVSAFWTFYKDAAKAEFLAIGGIVASFFTRWTEYVALGWNTFVDLADLALDVTSNTLEKTFKALFVKIGQAFNIALEMSWSQFLETVKSSIGWIAKAWASAMAGNAGMAIKLVSSAVSVAKSDEGKEGLKQTADAIDKTLSKIFTGRDVEDSVGELGTILANFGSEALKIEKDNAVRVAKVFSAAITDAKEARAKFATSLEGLGEDAKEAFLTEFNGIFAGVDGPVDSEMTAALRERLVKLMERVAKVEPEAAKKKKAEGDGKKGGVIAGAGGAGGEGGEAGAAAATPATNEKVEVATFSAAAAIAQNFGRPVAKDPEARDRAKDRALLVEQRELQKALVIAAKLTNTTLGQFINGMAFRV